jgi:hypothetical protein
MFTYSKGSDINGEADIADIHTRIYCNRSPVSCTRICIYKNIPRLLYSEELLVEFDK